MAVGVEGGGHGWRRGVDGGGVKRWREGSNVWGEREGWRGRGRGCMEGENLGVE